MGKSKKKKKESEKLTEIKNPLITDWIQAIAAAISIPAAIVAFFTFFQKDIDLQRQISNLDTISRQSIIQTEILLKQVNLLKEEQEFLKEQNELSLSHRQTEIEPKLVIEIKEYHGNWIMTNLINNGKIARIIKFEENKPNDFIIDIPFVYIGEGKEKEIIFRYKENAIQEKSVLNFKIVYEDIDKKERTMNFKFEDVEGIINRIDNNREIVN